MNRSKTRMIQAAALASLVALTACRTPRDFAEPRAGDPHARLALLLERWEASRNGAGRCALARTAETPLADCDRLRKQIERMTVDFPEEPAVLLGNAVVAYESGRSAEAEKDLDALRALDPVNPEAAALRARIALESGNTRLARRILEEQIGLTPDRAILHELVASVAYLEGDWSEARHALEIAFRLGGPTWRLAYHRGLVFEAEGRHTEAADAYRTCLELEPDFSPAQARLRGLAAADVGR